MLIKTQQYTQRKADIMQKYPLLWFNGNETIVITLLKEEVTNYYKSNHFKIEKHIIQNNNDWQHLFSELENTDLFEQQQRCWDIHFEKPSSDLLKPLEKLEKQGISAIISSSRIDAKSQKAKWFLELAELKNLAVMTLFDMNDIELMHWSLSFVPHLTLNPSAQLWWQQKMSGNALSAWQEAQKLNYIYPEKQTLDSTDLSFASGDFSQNTIFDVSTAWLSGQKKHAFSLIQKLQCSGNIDTTIILWKIVSDLRILLLLYEEIGENNSHELNAIAKKYGLWGEQLQAMTIAYKRYSITELEKRLHLAFQLEQQLKGKQSQGALDHLQLLALIR